MKDIVLPFLLQEHSFRGKVIKLRNSVHDIVTQHAYPDSISKILCQIITACTMIGDNFKHGILTIQLKSDGIIDLIIADYYDSGKIRAYANWDLEKFQTFNDDSLSFRKLIGNGTVAITIDQGPGTELYQGIVEIQGETLDDLLSAYFSQSEQIDTSFKIISSKNENYWCSGGIMLQKMPFDLKSNPDSVSDSWDEAKLFISTIKEDELVGDLEPGVLLHRLFHDKDIVVYDPKNVKHACRCSRDRAFNILKTLSKNELNELKLNNEVDVTCQFCSKKEIFTEDQLNEI